MISCVGSMLRRRELLVLVAIDSGEGSQPVGVRMASVPHVHGSPQIRTFRGTACDLPPRTEGVVQLGDVCQDAVNS
jgi:hypothetical protein